jgi:hypothetical protein
MHKSIKVIVKALEAQGFVVKLAKNGHPMVYLGGRLIATLPSTPSDSRSLPNSLAPLKRAGFQVPGAKVKAKANGKDSTG